MKFIERDKRDSFSFFKRSWGFRHLPSTKSVADEYYTIKKKKDPPSPLLNSVKSDMVLDKENPL